MLVLDADSAAAGGSAEAFPGAAGCPSPRRALTAEADPHRKVYWSFGSSLAQVAGEYARTNTAILNSYLGPTVEKY